MTLPYVPPSEKVENEKERFFLFSKSGLEACN
jgi:hypothetical protein